MPLLLFSISSPPRTPHPPTRRPTHIDIDSTIQELDMQYPSISNMLIKITGMARNIQKLISEKCDLSTFGNMLPHVDMKKIKGLVKTYFFIKRKKSEKNKEKKDIAMKELWRAVSKMG